MKMNSFTKVYCIVALTIGVLVYLYTLAYILNAPNKCAFKVGENAFDKTLNSWVIVVEVSYAEKDLEDCIYFVHNWSWQSNKKQSNYYVYGGNLN